MLVSGERGNQEENKKMEELRGHGYWRIFSIGSVYAFVEAMHSMRALHEIFLARSGADR